MNQQKKQDNPVKGIFTPNMLALLLTGANFADELKTPEQIALHNDRMKIIRGIIGDDSRMPEFISKVAELVFKV
jgi:hypothetical protein